MSKTSLRGTLIRVAHAHPELRPIILPVVRRTAFVGRGIHDDAWLNTLQSSAKVLDHALGIVSMMYQAFIQALRERESVLSPIALAKYKHDFHTLQSAMETALDDLRDAEESVH